MVTEIFGKRSSDLDKDKINNVKDRLSTLVTVLSAYIRNMHKHDDIDVKPLNVLEQFVPQLYTFYKKFGSDIIFIASTDTDPDRKAQFDRLSLLLKEFPYKSGIGFDPKKSDANIAESISISFWSGLVLNLSYLKEMIEHYDGIKDSPVRRLEIKQISRDLLLQINHLRKSMIDTVTKLKAIHKGI